ncbi:hypothetical protein QFZ56_007175 [Streptomyces achromogenes]|uniref:SWIM-type domain-containing protein n=1 Tax=Streptomyces achromogenes TaxID=67255 RepID=A0ABU0QC41_STRAH|nr:hypothetical protein [Streptomyces achromogenes]
MFSDRENWERASTARVVPPARPRKLAKVPFVELADGRLQGVVSSGSDIERVYVSSVAAGTYAFACSTNNNRPCGGARGSFCNHIRALITEAVLQYGADRVARYLRVEPAGPEADAGALTVAMTGARPPQADGKATAAAVFSRFLRHLAYLELAPVTVPLPELQWFPPTRAQAAPAATGHGPDAAQEARTGRTAAPVEGLDEALAAVDAFDHTLAAGLLRPRPDRVGGLGALARAVAGSPLAARVAEAAEKAAAGSASEDHLVALAAARTALLGSVHDALVVSADELSGRLREEPTPVAAGPRTTVNLLAAARTWLADLARTGWQGIDHELAGGAAPIVSAMLPEPGLRRPATLLDGFAAELAASCPGAALAHVPERRWADLWSRALLLTVPGAADTPVSGTATGRLLPLGVDLQEHATAAQAQVHAVLEPADGSAPRLVRASVSAPKPDTVVAAGVWQLLRPHLSLLTALGEGRSMELDAMPLTEEGDLLWDDALARPGDPADALATARVVLPTALAPLTAPLNRHPARIAEPVFLEGYDRRQEGDVLTFTVAGRDLPVDTDRIPAAGPLTPEAVAGSRACVGLLRWDDGGLRLQPLAVETTVRRKAVALHAGAWAGGTADKAGARAEKAATDAVTVLRERAGRLLRK